MISSKIPVKIFPKSQQGLLEFLRQAYYQQTKTYNLRENMRYIDRQYQREQDLTTEQAKAKAANRAGDATKFQNITIPVVAPQVETAVTYQASVFLTGYPMFGVVSAPETMDAALQMETTLADQATRGAWQSHFMLAFRDAFKYNAFALETGWQIQKVASLETDVAFSTKEAKQTQTLWEGNFIRWRNMYNMMWDIRVPLHEVHSRGEYAGFTEIMGRIEYRAFLNSMEGRIKENDKEALESGIGSAGVTTMNIQEAYYVPDINPNVVFPRTPYGNDIDWFAWAGMSNPSEADRIKYKNSYIVTTIYVRIMPSDFDIRVPNSNTPQIWKLVFTNNCVLNLAERQTNAHNNLGIIMGSAMVDGLDYQTKSLAESVVDFQSLASASYNSVIAAARRSVTDRVLYDPSRISSDQINNNNPAAKIPVRPSAYGKPIAESVYQFPYRSDNIDVMLALADKVDMQANKLTRQNPARQGQFVKGNKTRQEFDTIMGNATDEDQMIAIHFEATLFTPLKEMLKSNILQYQGGGSLLNRNTGQVVQIDPVAMRKAVMAFTVSDGLVPSSKIISGDALRDGFQTLAQVPGLAAGYNISPLFSYLMKTQGANIKAFEKPPEQVAFEQAVLQWQQVAMEIAKAGGQPPPMPTPNQFGYNPQQQASQTQQSQGVQTNEQSSGTGVSNTIV